MGCGCRTPWPDHTARANSGTFAAIHYQPFALAPPHGVKLIFVDAEGPVEGSDRLQADPPRSLPRDSHDSGNNMAAGFLSGRCGRIAHSLSGSTKTPFTL